MEGAVGYDVSVTHNEGLLETTRSGEGTSLVEATISGEQLVSEPVGSFTLVWTEDDVVLQLSPEIADGGLGHGEGHVHDVGVSGRNSVTHHSYWSKTSAS